MASTGRGAKTIGGEAINIHHNEQMVKDQGFTELPASQNKYYDDEKHPYNRRRVPTPAGQTAVGLTAKERREFDDFRKGYWKARAKYEIDQRKRAQRAGGGCKP